MKKKKIAIILGIVLTVLVGIFVYMLNPLLRYHNIQLSNAMKQLSEKDGQEIFLNEVVPFSWDAVYTFAPYTSKQSIEEQIGFTSNAITESVNEGMTQLIFVNDKIVVASICGYSDSLGYMVEFTDCVKRTDKIPFKVHATESYVELKALSKQ